MSLFSDVDWIIVLLAAGLLLMGGRGMEFFRMLGRLYGKFYRIRQELMFEFHSQMMVTDTARSAGNTPLPVVQAAPTPASTAAATPVPVGPPPTPAAAAKAPAVPAVPSGAPVERPAPSTAPAATASVPGSTGESMREVHRGSSFPSDRSGMYR